MIYYKKYSVTKTSQNKDPDSGYTCQDCGMKLSQDVAQLSSCYLASLTLEPFYLSKSSETALCEACYLCL